jgi:hypothetical protein
MKLLEYLNEQFPATVGHIPLRAKCEALEDAGNHNVSTFDSLTEKASASMRLAEVIAAKKKGKA